MPRGQSLADTQLYLSHIMPISSASLFPERAEFVHLEYGLTL